MKLRERLAEFETCNIAGLRVHLVALYFASQLKIEKVSLLRLVCTRLGLLGEKYLDIVVGWVQAWNDEEFGCVIDGINQLLGRLIDLVGLHPLSEARHCFAILEKLFRLNERLGRVQISRFYSDQVSELNEEQILRNWYLNKIKKVQFQMINVLAYPFLLRPSIKANILEIESKIDARNAQRMILEEGDLIDAEGALLINLVCKISRATLLEDAMKFAHDTKDFRRPLKVVFVGEKGVDQGGVRKQFFSLASKELFDTRFGMFRECNHGRLLWLNQCTFDPPVKFELAGILLGLAIYNSINIEINLSPLLYKKLLGQELGLQDLRLHDEQIFNNLKFILEGCADPSELGLNFTTHFDNFGEKVEVELVAGGAGLEVGPGNKHEYVRLLVDWLLNRSIEVQFNAFRKGFYKVMKGEMIRLFHYSQIEELVQGSPQLDFAALRAKTHYEGYGGYEPVVLWLWEVVGEFSEVQKRKFLFFCTGSERAPVGGLTNLQFIVQRHGEDTDKLPCASTCFNILLMPEYCSKDKLREKLFKAIENAQGFGLA